MGIPSYFSWIVRNHPAIIKKFDTANIPVNNLYLDCNSIIYDVIHATDFTQLDELSYGISDISVSDISVDKDYHFIIQSVCKKIDEYVDLLKPDQNVFIAFDGVAPVAKLDQQRERRYKTNYQHKMKRSVLKSAAGPDPWNTAAITPGTRFMNELNKKIHAKYDTRDKRAKKFIVSGSDEYGEGEHKLYQYIRDHPEEHVDCNTVIYGLDADLIMLSINHLPITKHIYLFRETPHFIQSLNSDLEPNEAYLMDIPELSRNIIENMGGAEDSAEGLADYNNYLYDYIFMCFFLGNDFMPHFPSINIRTGGVEKMLNAYKATFYEDQGGPQFLTMCNGTKIAWSNVGRFRRNPYEKRGETAR
jgi:5'-3' exoribonuclease 1